MAVITRRDWARLWARAQLIPGFAGTLRDDPRKAYNDFRLFDPSVPSSPVLIDDLVNYEADVGIAFSAMSPAVLEMIFNGPPPAFLVWPNDLRKLP